MKFLNFRFIVVKCLLFIPVLASAIEKPDALVQFLKTVEERSESVKAIQQSVEALKSEIKARDSVLSPMMASEIGVSRDQRKQDPSTQLNSRSRYFDFELSKAFATGTSASIVTEYNFLDSVALGPRYESSWIGELSQSLWRNGFGRGVSLRQKSDEAELKSRWYDLEFQKQNLLYQAESLFWDVTTSLKEEEIRLKNIERSASLEKWIADRVRRSAAETSDLVQVRALSSARRIALIENQNRLRGFKVRLNEFVPNLDIQDLKLREDQLNPIKSSRENTEKVANKLIRLDSLSAFYLAEKNKAEADQVSDSLSPELDLFLRYGKNGINEGSSESLKEAQTSNFSTTQMGVRFSMDLGFSLRKERQNAASLRASSQTLVAQSRKRESDLELTEVLESLKSYEQLVVESQLLMELQRRKSLLERQRYDIGQSTIFQAITFEIEAGEAEVNHYRTLAALKKEKAKLRLFVPEGAQL